jgi:hypothetical protein
LEEKRSALEEAHDLEETRGADDTSEQIESCCLNFESVALN